MSQQDARDLDARIHALLCDSLSRGQRDEVLALIATDEVARKLLDEMLTCRKLSRAAFGYDRADQAMDASKAAFMASLKSAWPADTPNVKVRRIRWRPLLWPAAAAAVAIAVSLYLAAAGRRDTANMHQEIASVMRQVAAAQVTQAEVTDYLRIWREVTSANDRESPWILLNNGGGRFEYLPSVRQGAASGSLILRCLIVSADGRIVEKINVLLPADRPIAVSLGEAGQLEGMPIRYNVVTSGRWITMDVKVGDNAARTVGVRGRVKLGDKMAGIGRFRIGNRDLQVFLWAVRLDGKVG